MGVLRLLLALVVATDHFRNEVLNPLGLYLPVEYQFGLNAGFAVMLFYTISGFLISTGLHRKYPETLAGTLRFYRSRFVRIFSLYWPVIALIFAFVPTAREAFLAASLPDQWTSIFLLGTDWRLQFTNYPNLNWNSVVFAMGQTWTLSAELTFYILAPFILRSLWAAWTLLILSACTRAFFVHKLGYDVIWTYCFLPSTFVFFLLGHMTRMAADRWGMLRKPFLGVGLLIASIAALLLGNYAEWDGWRFWAMTLCFAAALPSIFEATKNNRLMNALGDLSYPVYIIHFLLIIELVRLNFWNALYRLVPSGSAVPLVAAMLIVALMVAWFLHRFVERPVAKLLGRILGAKEVPSGVPLYQSITIR
jgi:peptidoglycan/LPS O-acetylase OafA/YrhL